MKKKELYLITNNTSWWKRKKFRKCTANELLIHRKLGWKLIRKTVIPNKTCSTETRTFTKYILGRN